MMDHRTLKRILIMFAIYLFSVLPDLNLMGQETSSLDEKVKTFLKNREGTWREMNIPESDGQLLYNIIVEKGYKQALEIGTSTGHSTIWIAWALSKTGGKVITIEIDRYRHEEALSNFKEAGLSEYIDARLADAHELVRELKGPFDFVFSDADKYWYTQYFRDVDPKLKTGGCFTAHNVWGTGGRRGGGSEAFYDVIKAFSNYDTKVDRRGGGLSISYKNSAE